LRDTEVQQPNTAADLFLLDQLAGLFGEQRPVGGRIDDDGLELLAEQPPFLFCSSMSISMVSLSVVSEMAMVPDSECRMPTLMVSPAPVRPGSARSP
jgi:hypothetical protein